MDSGDVQAKATIAAALIVARAVEIPTIPSAGEWAQQESVLRLRELTDFLYHAIIRPPDGTRQPG